MALETLYIDGSEGEGGGQILRTSLALSAITGRPFVVEKIRARRRKPGLLRQHLTAVRAAASVCGAGLQGAELGASRLEFVPGSIVHGEHRFAVGSAGSATLVFQTVLWPLLIHPGRSTLIFEGGTHNPLAPPFDFLQHVFLPILRRSGARIEAKLERAGFYPAGGGRFVVELEGGSPLAELSLREPGPIVRRRAIASLAKLPRSVATREIAVVRERLGWGRDECEVRELDSLGPGNAISLLVETEHACELVTAFGDKGVRAEQVAEDAVAQMQAWLAAEVAVGEHLADQLLIPMALHGSGELWTSPTSLHTRTNAELIARFLPVQFAIEPLEGGRERVRVSTR
ncbi:RNA 3'-terminal phosphate cyclase [Nannocystaceae bacterium ST9]